MEEFVRKAYWCLALVVWPFVYVIAPLIDNWVKEHLNKKLSAACLVLLLLFGADVVYSHFEPNVGEGVTQ